MSNHPNYECGLDHCDCKSHFPSDDDKITYKDFVDVVAKLEETGAWMPSDYYIIMDPDLYAVRRILPYRLWWTCIEHFLWRLVARLRGRPHENN